MASNLCVPDLGLYTAPYVITIPDPVTVSTASLPGSYDALFAATPLPDANEGVPCDDELHRAFNAYHYSRFMAEGRRRYAEMTSLDIESAVALTAQRLKARIEGWMGSAARVYGDGTDTQIALAVGLDWGAKLVCCLAKEAELL